MECINYKCEQHKTGICPNDCKDEIKPTHTPSYAEEQLEHANDKVSEHNNAILLIDYEQEYKNLKSRNEILQVEKDCLTKIKDKALEELKELKKGRDVENATIKGANERIEDLERILKDRNDYIHDLQVSHNAIDQENIKIREENSKSAEYFLKWGDAENKVKKLQGESIAFEKLEGVLRTKINEQDKKIEELTTENKKTRETIKKLSELL